MGRVGWQAGMPRGHALRAPLSLPKGCPGAPPHPASCAGAHCCAAGPASAAAPSVPQCCRAPASWPWEAAGAATRGPHDAEDRGLRGPHGPGSAASGTRLVSLGTSTWMRDLAYTTILAKLCHPRMVFVVEPPPTRACAPHPSTPAPPRRGAPRRQRSMGSLQAPPPPEPPLLEGAPRQPLAPAPGPRARARHPLIPSFIQQQSRAGPGCAPSVSFQPGAG